MRKLYLVLLFSLLYCFSYGQETLSKIAKSYFRSDPFSTQFSAFMSHLLNDPTITDKIIEKRTDSSLFYFQGLYQSFNPFFFKPKRLQVVLTELIVDRDSLPKDTIYSYQLFAYDDDTKQGQQEVRKEFEKIYRRYKGSFLKSQPIESTSDGEMNGVTYNLFDPLCAVSPFAVSWFGPTKKKEFCLVLSIRMDSYLNKAILPMPFYATQ